MAESLPEKPSAEQLDEQLVAYLDGELESQSAQHLESLLASDEQVRKRLNQLAVSWDLLDQLPRASVDDVFTRSTVEMAAVVAEEEIAESTAAAPTKRKIRWFAGGVATLMAAAVGFVAVGLAMPDRNDPLLRNLPIIVNLDLYRAIGDADLLKQLQSSNLFGDDSSESATRATSTGAASQATTTSLPLKLPDSIAERRAWIAGQGPDGKQDLNRNLEKYTALTPEEKQGLQGIEDYLQASSQQTDPLLRLMQRYHEWLKGLTTGQRADLSDAAPDKRLAEIKRLKSDQEERIFSRLGGGSGAPRDLDHILHWMQDIANQHESEILAALPEDERQELKKLEQRGGDRGGKRYYQRRLAWELWKPNSLVAMPPITDADLKPLVAQLTPDRQAKLAAAPETSEQIELLRQWIRAAMRSQRPQGSSPSGWRGGNGSNFERRRFDDEILKRFESNLSAEDKKRLSELSPEQKQSELWKMFQKERGFSGGSRQRMGPSSRPSDESMKDRDAPLPKDGPNPKGPPPERQTDEAPVPPPMP